MLCEHNDSQHAENPLRNNEGQPQHIYRLLWPLSSSVVSLSMMKEAIDFAAFGLWDWKNELLHVMLQWPVLLTEGSEEI